MKKIILISFSIIPLVLHAQLHDVDLSKKILDEKTIGLNYKGIKLINKTTKGFYKVSITVEQEPFGPDEGDEQSIEETDACFKEDFKVAYEALEAEENEAEIPQRKDELDKGFKKLDNSCQASLKSKYELLKKQTEYEVAFDFAPLKRNQNIIVTIERINTDDNSVIKSWIIILRTPRTVNYITHFGMTFAPNGERGSENFFSKADTANTYLIKKMNKNGEDFWKDLSLTANFIVYPFKFKNEDAYIKVGWAAGFGISGDAKFTIFTGPSIVLSDFISLNFAGGLYNRTRLKGEYEPNQRITENLNFDQLHEKGLRPSFIISLGFRLSKEQLQEAIQTVGGKQ